MGCGASKKNGGNIFQRYDFGRKLGEGSFGRVYLCTKRPTKEDPKTPEYAIKCILKSEVKNKARLAEEVEILKLVGEHHPNCLGMIEHCDDSEMLFIVMPLCTGQDALRVVASSTGFTVRDAAEIIKQALEGLVFLHDDSGGRKVVIHRDLKPENLLFSHEVDFGTGQRALDLPRGALKIIDFGLSWRLDTRDKRLKSPCGTLHYCAPEMLWEGLDYGIEADVWALGVTLYLMLFAKYPFEGKDDTQLMKAIVFNNESYDQPVYDLDTSATGMLMHMLEKDPFARLEATALLEEDFVSKRSNLSTSIPTDVRTAAEGAAVANTIDAAAVETRDKAISSAMSFKPGSMSLSFKPGSFKPPHVSSLASSKPESSPSGTMVPVGRKSLVDDPKPIRAASVLDADLKKHFMALVAAQQEAGDEDAPKQPEFVSKCMSLTPGQMKAPVIPQNKRNSAPDLQAAGVIPNALT